MRAFGHVWLLYVLTFIFSPQMLRWHHGGSRRIPLHATNQTIKYFPWEAANVQRWPKILSTSRRSRKFITKFYWTWIQIHINPTNTPCFFTSYREMTTISATFFDTHTQKKTAIFCTHGVLTRSVWLWQQTGRISLHAINRFVFVMGDLVCLLWDRKCIYVIFYYFLFINLADEFQFLVQTYQV